MDIKAPAHWRERLSGEAQRLLDAVELSLGEIPGSLSNAIAARSRELGAASVSKADLEALLAEAPLDEDQRAALRFVELGVPDLGHGGHRNFVGNLAEVMKRPSAKPKKARRSLLSAIFGSYNDREVKKLRGMVESVGALEGKVRALDAEGLRASTARFKERLAQGESLDALLPEAFATVRETGKRLLNLRHFDEQVIGGILLHQGRIAEMMTGEGKTLAATLPAYLNALAGEGVHVVTVNDYLAKRDVQWMGPIYHALGLRVGVLQSDGTSYIFDPTYQSKDPRMANLRPCERKDAYLADITYGTNNEFGFDYLRDNICHSEKEMVQRKPKFAIVDEVDNILIDEARTPMIISGASDEAPDRTCRVADDIVRQLTLAATIKDNEKAFEVEERSDGDYIVDEKNRRVILTDQGLSRVEDLLGTDNLYANIEMAHRVHQALYAHALFHRDQNYIVENGEVIIVDEHTGRPSPGRRWSNGLHQAIEAKEGVDVHTEDQTLATVTVQNYFRMYEKLAGMTGTASTEAEELAKTYNRDVVTVPTHKAMQRDDYEDAVFLTKAAKNEAILREIAELHAMGRPVLVGTTSIEESEMFAEELRQMGIAHRVLNAKEHEKEAEVVAQAGRLGAVTIATNMAGRGTDIVLGGNADFTAAAMVREGGLDQNAVDPEAYEKTLAEVKSKQAAGLLNTNDPEAYATALVIAREETQRERRQVLELGGMHIIGTTRNESRRIDDQLAGRAGRQGDPGSSQFYVSLEDDLLRLFGQGSVTLLSKLWGIAGLTPDQPLQDGRLAKAIRSAQKKIEGLHFKIREDLLKYDDVMNKQREVIYADRRRLLEGVDVHDRVLEMIPDVAADLIDIYTTPDSELQKSGPAGLAEAVRERFGVTVAPKEIEGLQPEELQSRITELARDAYQRLEKAVGGPGIRVLERELMRRAVDEEWKNHLLSLDFLKEGIGFRAYAQKDPLIEYKTEGFYMFQDLLRQIEARTVDLLFDAANDPAIKAA